MQFFIAFYDGFPDCVCVWLPPATQPLYFWPSTLKHVFQLVLYLSLASQSSTKCLLFSPYSEEADCVLWRNKCRKKIVDSVSCYKCFFFLFFTKYTLSFCNVSTEMKDVITGEVWSIVTMPNAHSYTYILLTLN